MYIRDIFDQFQFYNIPEYQRPYSWEKEHITALLDDITGVMEENEGKEFLRIYDMEFTSERSGGKTGSNINKYLYHDILDGQQRFITLFYFRR